jgi:hypothetical protein
MKTIIFVLLFAAQAVAGDLLSVCINAAVAESGAQAGTLAIRSILTSPTSTDEDRRQAAMRLNAIYNAAVASGRMEALRIQGLQSEQLRQQAANRQMQNLMLIQSWQYSHLNSNIFYPYYLPR